MGLALACSLLADRVKVTIAGRSEARLEDARRALGAPTSLRTLRVDIGVEDDVRRLFGEIGPLDHIVVTAADIAGAYALLPALEREAIDRVVASKLIGPLLVAKHGAAVLRPTGSIAFTSGIAAHRPAPRGTIVAAVNGAIEALVRALAVEIAPRRVNALSPGWVDTPIWDQVVGDGKVATLAAMAARLPVGRVGAASDIAQAFRFLIENGFTTGTVLHVEGGHRLA